MPSHLTRAVFRRLLASEPIRHHDCAGSLQRWRMAGLQSRRCATPCEQRRTFFNIFRAPPRVAREADLDPGLDKMMELSKKLRMQARPPRNEDIANAFQTFMIAKLESRSGAEDEQIKYAQQAFLHLLEQGAGDLINNKSIWRALRVCRSATQSSPTHRDFALELFREYEKRRQALPVPSRPKADYLHNTVAVLCNAGSPDLARQLVEEYLSTPQLRASEGDGEEEAEIPEAAFQRVWVTVLQAFAKERDEEGVRKTLDIINRRVGTSHAPLASAAMTKLYADSDRLEQAQEWYGVYRTCPANLFSPGEEVELYKSLLEACLRAENYTWGQTLIKDVVSGAANKQLWDLVLVWAAGTGKGVDEIDRMIDVLEKAQGGTGAVEGPGFVNIDTINSLVEFATSRRDPYMAERFVELGRRRNIEPNAKTLTLQMDYRLSVNDIDGALVAYQLLQGQDLTGDGDVPTVNELICAMCGTGRHDFDSIMNVAADLSDRQARFTSQTVAKLSILHLSRGELHDVLDLLNTHAYHFSSADRGEIRDTLVAYIVRPATTTAQAWDAYSMVRDVFDEMGRSQRTEIMNDFFRRERPDMAIYVFNTMRAHTRMDTVSNIDTYLACLAGVARLKDEESLDAVHNQLKLDYSIEPTTRLRNALMRTYTACDRARRALGFWDDIASSREGPSVNSIHLAFRACEKAPWGDRKAREIWERLKRTGMELDNSLWASYAGGLVGNGDVDGTIAELEQAHAESWVTFDAFLLGSVFDAAPGQTKQSEVEEWAKQAYPQQWAELERSGIRTEENGMRHSHIDRNIEP